MSQDFVKFLLNRKSHKKLVAPAPQGEQLARILQAGLRAPDHGKLKPYHFHVCQGETLAKLSELMLECCDELNLPEKFREKAANFKNRAPMVITVVAKNDPNHHKVPVWEQEITAGCATLAIQLAANAEGFDNFWITAKWVEGTAMRKFFNCESADKIVAFLLMGTKKKDKDKDQEKEERKKEKKERKEAEKLHKFVSFHGEDPSSEQTAQVEQFFAEAERLVDDTEENEGAES